MTETWRSNMMEQKQQKVNGTADEKFNKKKKKESEDI